MISILNDRHASFFTKLLGERYIVNEEIRISYGSDETEDLNFPPSAVLKPNSVGLHQ